jgi:hypothetical protein
MAREKTGEELLNSINDNTSAEDFELLFAHLSNHISWFKADRGLSDAEVGLDCVWKAIQIKIENVRDPGQLKRRFEEALEKMRNAGGPITFN